eukprot:8136426-Lingulodinium_polyedra.AAC.1
MSTIGLLATLLRWSETLKPKCKEASIKIFEAICSKALAGHFYFYVDLSIEGNMTMDSLFPPVASLKLD